MFAKTIKNLINLDGNVSAWITIFISILSLIVSLKTCSDSQKFSEINAEVQWSTLLEYYQNVDNEIRQWEESKWLKRSGEVIENRNALDVFLKKLKSDFGASDHIIRLYRDRSDRYDSLSNIAKRYEEVRDRMKNLDIKIPEPPRQSGFPYTLPFKLE
jgi:hypothetical protein